MGGTPGVAQQPAPPAAQALPAPVLSPAAVLTPEQALDSFKLAPGLKLEVAAAEPLIAAPVAIAFGTDGRMWVVEMRGYSPVIGGAGEDAPTGRVVVLRDRNGDGRYDESTVFLDNLVLPRAIMLVGDGALVGAPPELAFWRDTDGDGKADKKIVVATDYGAKPDPKLPLSANPELMPNGPLWAYDNWIYSAAYMKKFRYVKGAFETGPTISRGQWGLTQDDYGRFYFNDNTHQLHVDMIFSDYLQRRASDQDAPRLAGTNVNAAADELVWPARATLSINSGARPERELRDGRLKTFTAACGPWIYRGDLTPELYGSAVVAEPVGNLVHRDVLTVENGKVVGRNPYDQQELIASTDERFRPVNFATGPDGALYVVDMYRGIVEHHSLISAYLREQTEGRKLELPHDLGRIYRVVPAGKPAPRSTQIAPLSNAQWVERLSHPNAWWRETAQRILVESGDARLVPAIRTVASSGTQPLGRVHALWTLDGLGALERATVVGALADREPVVRAAALRLSERFLKDSNRADLLSRVLAMTKDPSPEVQLQAVLTFGQAGDAGQDVALAQAVRALPTNMFARDALYSGMVGRELPLIERLVADSSWPADDDEANRVLSGLARGVVASRQVPAIERLLTIAASQPPAAGKRTAALVDGIAAAAAGPGALRRPILFPKEPAGWSVLSANADYRTRLEKINDVVLWPGKPGVTATAVAAPLTTEQQARFTAGKTLFSSICAACHQITGRGQDGLAPPLLDSDWVNGNPEALVRVVMHGVSGAITVNGREYIGEMPGLGALDDAQLASVLTYLRREWGHTASPVDPEQVSAIRAATAGRTTPFGWRELTPFRVAVPPRP